LSALAMAARPLWLLMPGGLSSLSLAPCCVAVGIARPEQQHERLAGLLQSGIKTCHRRQRTTFGEIWRGREGGACAVALRMSAPSAPFSIVLLVGVRPSWWAVGRSSMKIPSGPSTVSFLLSSAPRNWMAAGPFLPTIAVFIPAARAAWSSVVWPR